ncbi:NepR family anti-sigma factor [Denitrobaculum tricleocarpae]|nr:NepR family anti-sigma factor [Denitrobaculum tricleocarpae]
MEMTSDEQAGGDKGRGAVRGKLSTDAQDKIGEKLRGMYETVATEPIPEKFLDLLKSLEEAEQGQKRDDE